MLYRIIMLYKNNKKENYVVIKIVDQIRKLINNIKNNIKKNNIKRNTEI